MAGSINSQHL